MPITDLFRHRSAPGKLAEPAMSHWTDSPASDPDADPVQDDEELASAWYTGRDDLSGSNAVFGLIGTAASVEEGQSRRKRDGGASSGDELIDALYAQYCQALDDPQASVAGDWAAPGTPSDSRDGNLSNPRVSLPDDQHAPVAGMESIEALLSGTHLMEHAFGPLGGEEAADLVATAPVPEILRLFAPAEFHAAAARRSSALPPALARREHHSLSIDSAMSVPQSESHCDDAT